MRRHMLEFGTTTEQFGAIAVACRRNANHHPGAVMHDKPMTLDDYLASAVLADPLRLFDSCLISDGGAAYVTTSIERARDLPQPPAVVRGVGEGISGTGRALEPAARVHEHAPGVQRTGRVRDGRHHAGRRRRAHALRPVHRRRAHADRGHGLLHEGRGRRVRRGRHAAGSTARTAPVQHARWPAVARVRARHRARRRDREAAPGDRTGAGAGLRGRGLRRVHGPAREHAVLSKDR